MPNMYCGTSSWVVVQFPRPIDFIYIKNNKTKTNKITQDKTKDYSLWKVVMWGLKDHLDKSALRLRMLDCFGHNGL